MAALSTLEESMVIPAYPIWRLSVAQYHDMIQAGILTEDDTVELLEGWLVTKVTKNPRHILAVRRLRNALEAILPSGWFVNMEQPIMTADSVPEPDASIIRGQPDDYPDRLASPGDVALIVEISDSTLQQDRTLKLRLYAHARIPTYWIVNLQDRQLEVYSDPFGEGKEATYRRRDIYAATDTAPVMIEGWEASSLSVDQLIP